LHLWFKKEEGKEGRKEGRKEGKERRKGGRKEGRKEGKEGAGGVQAMPEADRLRHLNIMLFSENEYNLGNSICFVIILDATGVLQYIACKIMNRARPEFDRSEEAKLAGSGGLQNLNDFLL